MPVENIEPLLYWCKEREAIRIKRARLVEVGDHANDDPLTIDPILSEFRFCNVRRRDDRVSKWLQEHVLIEENIAVDLRSFLMFSALCRWINWPPTIKAIMDAGLVPSEGPMNWKAVGKLIDGIAKNGKAWTGAYMIRAPGKKGVKKGHHIATTTIGKNFAKVVPDLVTTLHEGIERYPSGSATYQDIWRIIAKADGHGSFMAGQIAGDWTYTTLLDKAPDLKTWAPMGPGSIRGFNRLMGYGKSPKKPKEELWLEKLAEWRAAIVKHLGRGYGDLTALDVQNCLCETDKFLRVRNGEGRPRARYQPHTY